MGKNSKNVEDKIKSFYEELETKQNGLTKKILLDNYKISSSDVGTKPEKFTEKNLIHPILDTLGFDYVEQPFKEGAGWPDFEIIDSQDEIIGECKPVNKYEESVEDIKDYLQESGRESYGIATDGIRWSIQRPEFGGDLAGFRQTAYINLSGVMRKVASKMDLIDDSSINGYDDIKSSVEELRDIAKLTEISYKEDSSKDVDKFYNRYVKLVFEDDNSLTDSISYNGKRPISKSERQEFAVNLTNRLIFIGYLEEIGVLEDGFIQKRLKEYESSPVAGNLYDTQFKPLFFRLLNVPRDAREMRFRNNNLWYNDIPYLNGGLFQIREYEEELYVSDDALEKVIRNLVLASDVDSLEPSVLGSVFEKLTNKISNENDRSDSGAFYTPDDLATHVNNNPINERVKEIVANEYGYDEDSKEEILSMNVDDIMDDVERGNPPFLGKEEARNCKRRVKSLTVLDPACGSGHFLTVALDRLSTIVLTFDKVANPEEKMSSSRRYKNQKDILLNCIFGVELSSIATEIAKFRVWLKIIDGTDWSELDERLPNIDANIVQGNSLTGLPQNPMSGDRIHVDIESTSGKSVDMETLAAFKKKYKNSSEESYKNIITDARESSNRELVKTLNEKVKLSNIDDYNDLSDYINETEVNFTEDGVIDSQIDYIKLKPAGRSYFSGEQKRVLKGKSGCKVHKKSARIDVSKREDVSSKSKSKIKILLQEIELLCQRYNIDIGVVKRKPTMYDLNKSTGKPVHWPIAFPEVTNHDGNSYDVNFDIIVGNPPYGRDVLTDTDKAIISGYSTSGCGDIVGNFIERQLQLSDENTRIGNVLSNGVMVNQRMDKVRKILEKNTRNNLLAYYGTRPSSFFSVEKRICTLFTNVHGYGKGTYTSDANRFMSEQRNTILSETTYESARGFDIEGSGGSIIAKIGHKEKANILNELKNHRSLDDVYGDGEYELQYRKSGGYWLQSLIDYPYSSSKVDTLSFQKEIDRNLSLILLNSSFFYMWWVTYGNGRDLNSAAIDTLPYPNNEIIEENADMIDDLSDRIDTVIDNSFDPEAGRNGEFNGSECREIVDEADGFIADLLGVDEHSEYLKNYHRHIRS